jgi:hypothetical protein
MIGNAGQFNDHAISPTQAHLELETARKTVTRLARAIKMVGNAGVSDPETSVELEAHLGAAYAAACRWLLESHIQADEVGRTAA